MHNSYKKSMDAIILSDELKNKIKRNAMDCKKSHTARSVYIRRVSGLAACLVVAAGSVFLLIHESTAPEQPYLAVSTPPESPVTVGNDGKFNTATPEQTPENSLAKEKNTAVSASSSGKPGKKNASNNTAVAPPPQPSGKEEDSLSDDTLFAEVPPAQQEPSSPDVLPGDTDTEPAPPDITAIVNPMQSFQSIEDLKATLAFEIKTPAYVPEGYKVFDIAVISGDLVQIQYRKDGEEPLTYRTKQNAENCSGDFNVYEKEETISLNGTDVVLKSNSGLFFSAVWKDETAAYSVSSPAGLTKAELLKIIQSVLAR